MPDQALGRDYRRLYAHAAQAGHATQIVALDVDDHAELRALLPIGIELLRGPGIALGVPPARASALDRAREQPSVGVVVQQELGRGADDIQVPVPHRESVGWARVLAEPPQHVEWMPGYGQVQAACEVDLVHLP